MPRITSRRKIYMEKDIGAWVLGQMREKRKTQADMAKALGISQPAFSKKIKSNHLSYSDLITIFQELETEDEAIIKLMKIRRSA